MGMLRRTSAEHPFPYVGHGVAAARKHMSCVMVFRAEPSAAERERIPDGLPELMAEFVHWQGKVFSFGHDSDSLQWAVRAAYQHVVDDDIDDDSELPTPAQWRAFNADIDRWLLNTHADHAVAVFVKPIDTEYGTGTDEWHEWSLDRVDQTLAVLDAAGEGGAGVAQYVRALWQARQDARNAPPPGAPPSLEEADAVFRQLVATDTGERLEDRFTAAFSDRNPESEFTLASHYSALVDAGREDDAIALARLVLRAGVAYPTHWWPPLAQTLIDLGRLDEAEEVVREVVWHLESYSPDHLVVCMDYHRARGEHDREAAAYFGGKRLFKLIGYYVDKERAASYGPVPRDARERYARWLHEWIGDRFEARKIARVGHWLVWFGNLKSKVFETAKQELEAERDRRIGLRKELTSAADPARVAEIVAALLEVPAEANDMLACGYAIHEKFPKLAFDLYEHGLASEGVKGYKGAGWHRCANNLLYQCLQSEQLLARADRALALAAPWGRRNPAIFHNAACICAKRGDTAGALDYIARAVASDYDNLAGLEADDAFDAMRDSPEFAKALAKN